MALPGFERKDLAWGQSRGTSTTKRTTKVRPSQRKGKASKRHEFVKNVVREVAGNAPYERRLMELLRSVWSPSGRVERAGPSRGYLAIEPNEGGSKRARGLIWSSIACRNGQDKKARRLAKARVRFTSATVTLAPSRFGGFVGSTGTTRKLTHLHLAQLGTLRRGKRKVDELTNVIAEQRRAH